MPSSVLNSMSLRMGTFSSHIRLRCDRGVHVEEPRAADGSVANDGNQIAPPQRSLRSRRHSNTSSNGSVLCVTVKLPGHVRVGSLSTEPAGPAGHLMSASSPKATGLLSRRARSRVMHCSNQYLLRTQP